MNSQAQRGLIGKNTLPVELRMLADASAMAAHMATASARLSADGSSATSGRATADRMDCGNRGKPGCHPSKATLICSQHRQSLREVFNKLSKKRRRTIA